MEYTKDIVLEIGYKRQIGRNKLKKWTSKLFTTVKANRLIILTITLLVSLMVADFLLINSFINLATTVY